MRKAVRSRPEALSAERAIAPRDAWTLPLLAHGPTRAVGGDGDDDAAGTVAWIAAGATLDVRGFVPSPLGRGWLLLDGVAGQATLASHEPDEAAVLDVLARRHGQLAVEQVLCEDGLVHWCSQQRGYPGIPLEKYSAEDLRREYHTKKHCADRKSVV